MYALAALLALWSTLAAALVHVLLALIWLSPDQRAPRQSRVKP